MNKIALIVLLISTMISCDKDTYEFPDARVNYYLYPNNLEYAGLHSPGGYATIEGGVNGILLFHNFIFNDYSDIYNAYDRACTNDPLNSCEQVYVDEENLNTLSCLCCESQYFIFDGAVIKGPAKQALHRYSTSFDGVTLRIFN